MAGSQKDRRLVEQRQSPGARAFPVEQPRPRPDETPGETERPTGEGPTDKPRGIGTGTDVRKPEDEGSSDPFRTGPS